MAKKPTAPTEPVRRKLPKTLAGLRAHAERVKRQEREDRKARKERKRSTYH